MKLGLLRGDRRLPSLLVSIFKARNAQEARGCLLLSPISPTCPLGGIHGWSSPVTGYSPPDVSPGHGNAALNAD